MIPDWMKEVNVEPCGCSAVYHGKKSFIGRTIEEIIGFMENTFFSEGYSRRKGLLQSLDPRIKLVSIMTVIVATSLIRDLKLLILFIHLRCCFRISVK